MECKISGHVPYLQDDQAVRIRNRLAESFSSATAQSASLNSHSNVCGTRDFHMVDSDFTNVAPDRIDRRSQSTSHFNTAQIQKLHDRLRVTLRGSRCEDPAQPGGTAIRHKSFLSPLFFLACSASSLVPSDSSTYAAPSRVVKKVSGNDNRKALEMMQQILQRKRAGIVDLETLGIELRRRLKSGGNDTSVAEINISHNMLHEPFDPACAACVACKSPAGHSGVAASSFDGRLSADETILYFDFAVNFPVSPQGESVLGCCGLESAISLVPVVGRTTEDLLYVFSETRTTLSLEHIRVVVKADRETALVRCARAVSIVGLETLVFSSSSTKYKLQSGTNR